MMTITDSPESAVKDSDELKENASDVEPFEKSRHKRFPILPGTHSGIGPLWIEDGSGDPAAARADRGDFVSFEKL
jgi:hypothetical protein